jgi:DNA replication licensing factor MCM7
MNLNECKDLLKKFILDLPSEKENFFFLEKTGNKKINKYHGQIQNIIHKEGRKFVFEYNDLKKIPSKILKYHAFSNTQRFLEILRESIDEIIQTLIRTFTEKQSNFLYKQISRKEINKKNFYQIILVPGGETVCNCISKLEMKSIGKFSYITGKIFKQNPIKIVLREAVYSCNFCKIKIYQKIKYEKFKPLFHCPSKNCRKTTLNNKVFINLGMSFFEKFQEISLKKNNETRENYFKQLKVLINGENVQKFFIGESIRIGGILTLNNPVNDPEQVYNTPLYFNTFFLEKKKINNNHLRASNVINIIELCGDSNLYQKLASSIAPEIYGNIDLKKGLLLSLLAIFNENKSLNHAIRKQTHILFLGKNGTGKSSLLKFVSEILSEGQFICPSYVLEEDKKLDESDQEDVFNSNDLEDYKILNNNLLCLDEIDKFSIKKRKIFNQILDKQIILPKKNLLKNPPESTLIATASIDDGNSFLENFHYEKHEQLKFYQKFDLIFFLESCDAVKTDYKIAKKITERYLVRKDGQINILKKEFIKSYLSEASKIKTVFPSQLFDLVTYNYVVSEFRRDKRRMGIRNVNYIFTVFRISISLAQLRFQKLVSKKDLFETFRLIDSSKNNFSSSNNTKESAPLQSVYNKIYSLIRNISYIKNNLTLDLFLIEKIVKSKGFGRSELIECLDFFESLNIWTISLNQGKLVFLI